MITQEEIIRDIDMLIEGGLFSMEEGEGYKSLLTKEEPVNVVQKLFRVLEEKDIDAEGDVIKGEIDTILQMKKNAEQNRDELLRAEAERLDAGLQERISKYEAQANELEKKYREVIAPKRNEIAIEEQRKKIQEM